MKKQIKGFKMVYKINKTNFAEDLIEEMKKERENGNST